MQGRSGLFSDCHTRATRTKVSAFGRMSDIAFRRGRWSQRVWLEGRGKGVKSERGGRLRLRSSSEGIQGEGRRGFSFVTGLTTRRFFAGQAFCRLSLLPVKLFAG
eukprot:490684-Amorphochlora_amoeboformis.AAC.1